MEVMLADNYIDSNQHRKINPVGWFMSEKYDGVRGIWLNNKLYSRNGHVIPVGDWFYNLMYDLPCLDGELYLGKGTFEACGAFRRSEYDPKIWNKCRFMIFDLPDDGKSVFRDRYKKLLGIHLRIANKWIEMSKSGKFLDMPVKCPVEIVKQFPIFNIHELELFYQKIISDGGEGIILKDAESVYVKRRTAYMLKYKPVCDSEAVIVGYKPGNGKFEGLLGAFIVHPIDSETGEQNSRLEFSVSGMTLKLRKEYEKTHPIGTVITYYYRSLTKSGKPRHPTYKGVRT